MPKIHTTHGKLAVVSSTAQMPNSCKGRYRYVAVVELRDGADAQAIHQISERDRSIARIVWKSPPANVGLTERSAFYQMLKLAEAEATAE